MNLENKYARFAIPILFLAICYFPLFLHLDNLSLAPFDESRLAVNAIEMLENDNLLVTHFDGKPDMWNTKPPLMIWIQVAFISILGPNELAVRLPAALAGLLTLLVLWFFCRKEMKMPWLGYVSAGVLVTTQGYVGDHVTRSGDYDALLILWLTLSVFSFFRYQQHREVKYLYLTSVLIALAVLTKSVAGMIFLPGMLIFAVGSAIWPTGTNSKSSPTSVAPGAIMTMGKVAPWFLAILLCIGIIGLWYLIREVASPGYVKAVWENEWAGRYLNTLEDHNEPFFFYTHRILHFDFVPWVYVLPLGIFAGLNGSTQLREFTKLILFISVPFLLVISFSQTKLYWYAAPVYPLMAILVGIGLHSVFQVLLKQSAGINNLLMGGTLIVALFGFPYKEMIEKVYHPKPEYPCLQYGAFLKKIPGYDKFDITSVGYNAPVLFYVKSYRRKGKKVNIVNPSILRQDQHVMVCEENIWKVIQEKYEYEVLQKADTCCALILIR